MQLKSLASTRFQLLQWVLQERKSNIGHFIPTITETMNTTDMMSLIGNVPSFRHNVLVYELGPLPGPNLPTTALYHAIYLFSWIAGFY